ncbi:MAG: glycosyltransferase family 2 protein [Lachnospiraceae bacterium]|nr:glycosyltransferase family 2 protein [Lachnospiraceae bacterium]
MNDAMNDTINNTIDVIIPTYKPDQSLRELLDRLMNQTMPPGHILLINTEKELFDERLLEGLEVEILASSGEAIPSQNGFGAETDRPRQAAEPWNQAGGAFFGESGDGMRHRTRISLAHIRKLEFDHGGTRHLAASLLRGKLILFMTQDAMPENSHLIENLARPFADPRVCASYARQLPRTDCALLERYSRSFNYPPLSRIKTAEDLSVLGIKTYFCSNVCAMYRRVEYEELGGFERHTIFNEDMIFAGRLVQSGKAIAYCADAEVIHSHNYSGVMQFHRNFDLGVSQAEHPEIFAAVRSESEGIDMVKKSASYVIRKQKPWLLFSLLWQSGCKYLGYRLGKNYRRLPEGVVRACSMNKNYWQKSW